MSSKSSAKYVLMTSFITDNENYPSVLNICSQKRTIDEVVDRATYHYEEENLVVDLFGFETMAALSEFLLSPSLASDEQTIRPYLTHDIRREIVELHTVVKPLTNILPTTEKIQIRYIEVPGRRLSEYFEWRESTIFQHVRENEEVDGFVAYQSLVSNRPGVNFFVEYDSSDDELVASFQTPRYKKIIQEANRYIVGGSDALYTKFLKRVFVANALVATPELEAV